MIVLQPNTSVQDICFTSRKEDFSTLPYTMVIREDGTGEEQTISDIGIGGEGALGSIEQDVYSVKLRLDPTPSILIKEDGNFSVEIKDLWENLIWRGKIYTTSQVDYNVKHKLSQEVYMQYNPVDDNTYVIN